MTRPAARDQAVHAYHTWLLTVAKRKVSTVNAHLSAIDDFHRRSGLGPSNAKRQESPRTEPRVLGTHTRIRWLRAVEDANPRDKALAYTGLYTGARGAETCALDLADLRTEDGEGHLVIRDGNGGKHRVVPLHPTLRTALDAWQAVRGTWPRATENPALFLNHRGGRLSTRGAYAILRSIAESADLETGDAGDFTPRFLRHTTETTPTAQAGDDGLRDLR